MAGAKKTDDTEGFSAEERAAMKERAAELRKAKGRGKGSKAADQEAEVLARIAELPDADRAIAEPLHALMKEVAPELTAKTWYGMPAYAQGTKIVCFFQGAGKFKTRYSSFGFNDIAQLDDGSMWPTAYALAGWDDEVADRIAGLVRRALGR